MKFLVEYQEVVYRKTVVEAESISEARELVENGQINEFEDVDTGELEVTNVEFTQKEDIEKFFEGKINNV